MPSSTPDLVIDAGECGDAGNPPVNPFVANRYHYGMLLGVDDFETEQGYHRGKSWLHAAWLHGAGTVWGLGVDLRPDHREVAVGPGLAVDAAGRELTLDREHCLDIGRWFNELAPDSLTVEDLGDGRSRFRVHVVIAAHSCADRPIPAMAEPCGGSGPDTALSRTVEMARLDLVAGAAPAQDDLPYPLLRQLFGIAEATEPAAIEALDDLAGSPAAENMLAWFRRLAADDVVSMTSFDSSFPAEAGEPLVLADLEITVREVADRLVVEDTSTVDNRVRRSHVATSTIQELLCGRGGDSTAAPGPGPGPGPDPDDDGPRIDPDTVELEGRDLRFRSTQPLDERSVIRAGFEVTVLQPSGWRGVNINNVKLDEDDPTLIHLRLNSSPTARPMRVLVRGSGRTPVVGTDFRPIAGTVGGRPGSDHDGHDAAFMIHE